MAPERGRASRLWALARAHPRATLGVLIFYVTVAALSWWASAPPPLDAVASAARAETWDLPAPQTVPARALPALERHGPWPESASARRGKKKGGKNKTSQAGSSALSGLVQVAGWGFVGIVRELPAPPHALFLDPRGNLHRLSAGDKLPKGGKLIGVSDDSIVVQAGKHRERRRLYAPAAATHGAAPAGTAPAPGTARAHSGRRRLRPGLSPGG